MGKKSDRAQSMDRNGYCLLCNEKKPNRCRGLCPKHYKQFHKEKSGMTEEQQEEFETRLIRLGYLMPSKKRGRQTGKSVFEEISKKVTAS